MIYNGPRNLWKTHIEEITNKYKTSFYYSNNYYGLPDLEFDLEFTDTFIPLPYINNNLLEIIISDITRKGSEIVDFRYDDANIALHSDTTQWQEFGGYNDFYDWVFDHATSMKRLKLVFESNNKSYVIWAWKGNYMLLGAGSEVGFYTQDEKLESFEEFTGLEQWMVADELPMTLSLYHVNGNGMITDSYYHWLPDEEQWWITGFVPNIYDYSVKADELIQIASVDFSFNPQLIIDLKNEYKNKIESQSLIFDLEDNMLWLIW